MKTKKLLFFIVLVILGAIIFFSSFFLNHTFLKISVIIAVVIILLITFINLLLAYKELYKENKLFAILGALVYIYFSFTLVFVKIQFGELNHIISNLTLIATLLVVFIPEGLIKINEKTKLIEERSYYKEKILFTKNTNNIFFPLIVFIGSSILINLLGIFFKNDTYINHYILSNNVNDIIKKIIAMIYYLVIVIGAAMLITSYVGIFDISRNIYIFVRDSANPKSNNNHKDSK
jgi:hypothetical protein